jgi:cell division protein FtsB
MKELEQRRRPMHLLSLRLFTVALLLIALLLVRGVWNIYHKERETHAGRAQAEQELADIEKREMALRGEIARLRSPYGVEASLREQFDLAREGEGVIVIVETSLAETEDDIGVRTQSTWKRLIPLAPWNLFGR